MWGLVRGAGSSEAGEAPAGGEPAHSRWVGGGRRSRGAARLSPRRFRLPLRGPRIGWRVRDLQCALAVSCPPLPELGDSGLPTAPEHSGPPDPRTPGPPDHSRGAGGPGGLWACGPVGPWARGDAGFLGDPDSRIAPQYHTPQTRARPHARLEETARGAAPRPPRVPGPREAQRRPSAATVVATSRLKERVPPRAFAQGAGDPGGGAP